MPTRKCGSSGWRTSCGSSPARTRNCNTATASLRIGCGQLGSAPAAPGGQPPVAQPDVAAAPPRVQPGPPQGQQGYPQQGYPQQAYPQAAARLVTSSRRLPHPRPIVQDPAAPAGRGPPPRRCLRSQPESQRSRRAARARRRSDAGRRDEAPVGAPGGRGPGEPLNLGAPARAIRWRLAATGYSRASRARRPGASAALTTLPPSATSKDEFDLGIGYMQRKDYALAEETMKNFAQKYPSDPLIADLAILARRELFPAPAISRRRGGLSRRDHQIR